MLPRTPSAPRPDGKKGQKSPIIVLKIRASGDVTGECECRSVASDCDQRSARGQNDKWIFLNMHLQRDAPPRVGGLDGRNGTHLSPRPIQRHAAAKARAGSARAQPASYATNIRSKW